MRNFVVRNCLPGESDYIENSQPNYPWITVSQGRFRLAKLFGWKFRKLSVCRMERLFSPVIPIPNLQSHWLIKDIRRWGNDGATTKQKGNRNFVQMKQ